MSTIVMIESILIAMFVTVYAQPVCVWLIAK